MEWGLIGKAEVGNGSTFVINFFESPKGKGSREAITERSFDEKKVGGERDEVHILPKKREDILLIKHYILRKGKVISEICHRN